MKIGLEKGIIPFWGNKEVELDDSKCPNSVSGPAIATFFGRNCDNEKSEPHTCPFKEEINHDLKTLCECCDNCTYECAMDI